MKRVLSRIRFQRYSRDDEIADRPTQMVPIVRPNASASTYMPIVTLESAEFPALADTDYLKIVVMPTTKPTVYQISTCYRTTSKCSILVLLSRALSGHRLKTKELPKALFIAPMEALALLAKTGKASYENIPVYADSSLLVRQVVCSRYRPEEMR